MKCKIKAKTRIIAAQVDGVAPSTIKKYNTSGENVIKLINSTDNLDPSLDRDTQIRENRAFTNALKKIKGFMEDGLLVPPPGASRVNDITTRFFQNVAVTEQDLTLAVNRLTSSNLKVKGGVLSTTSNVKLINAKLNRLLNTSDKPKSYVKEGNNFEITYSKSLFHDYNNYQYDKFNKQIASLSESVLLGEHTTDEFQRDVLNLKSEGVVAHLDRRLAKLRNTQRKLKLEPTSSLKDKTAVSVEMANIEAEKKRVKIRLDEIEGIEYLETHLSNLGSRLNSTVPFTAGELIELYETVSLIKAAGRADETNTFLMPDDRKNPELVDKVAVLAAKARQYEVHLDEIAKDTLFDMANDEAFSNDLERDELFKLVDPSVAGSYVRGAQHINNPVIQMITQMIDRKNIEANIESTAINTKISELYKEIQSRNKTLVLNLMQTTTEGDKTGRIVDRFSPQWFKSRRDILKTPYRRNASTQAFDTDILFEGNDAERIALEKKLREDLGDFHFEMYYEKAKTNYEVYKKEEENAKNSLTDKEFEDWYMRYSPSYRNAHYADKGRKSKRGTDTYLVVVPLKKYKDGTPTEYYDDNFDEIAQDSEMSELYKLVRTTADDAQRSLGRGTGSFAPPSLGYVKKDVGDLIKKGDYSGAVELSKTGVKEYFKGSSIKVNEGLIDINSLERIEVIKPELRTISQETAIRVELKLKEDKVYKALEEGSDEQEEYRNKVKVETLREVNDETSDDLLQAIALMNISNINLVHKRQIEPEVLIATKLLKENMYGESEDAMSMAQEVLQHFVKVKYYNLPDRAVATVLTPGARRKLADGEEVERAFTDRDVESTMLPFVRLLYLGYALPAATFNFFNGIYSNAIQVAEGKMSMGDLMGSYFNVGTKKDRSLVKRLFALGDLGLEYDKQTLYDKGGFLAKFKNPMVFQIGVESVNQGVTTIARLKTLMVQDENGNEVSMYEAIGENDTIPDNYTLEGYEGLRGAALMAAVVVRDIRPMNARAHGDYNSPLLADRSTITRAGLTFSKYLGEMFVDRFGAKGKNHMTGESPEGRFRSAGKMLVNMVRNGTFAELTEEEQRRAYVGLGELAFAAIFYMIVSALKADACKDSGPKCKKQGAATLLALNTLTRVSEDFMSVTLTPVALFDKARNPFVVVSALEKLLSALGLVAGNIAGMDSTFYKQDTDEYEEGESKAWRQVKGLLPVYNSNYSRINRMTTGLQSPMEHNIVWDYITSEEK